jgi:hypothetical protein
MGTTAAEEDVAAAREIERRGVHEAAAVEAVATGRIRLAIMFVGSLPYGARA